MVQVTVREGVLEGEILESELGGSYCSFKGIPYAEPPVGDLRFKAPQPKKPWEGVLSAKQFGNPCYQVNFTVGPEPFGSEDCLYLNVYTPNIKPAKPLPVMFWIHGGGFVWGSGSDDLYGPEYLIRHDVILVTFNYRLEVLGYLSLDTEDIPGNAGMKDQVAALRWVKKNISSFGGDPENITIFGESAGAASVSFHLISPMTKGLFKRAIIQSGAATNWWSHPVEPRERALILARQLGCQSDGDKALYEFFNNQPLKKLINIKAPVSKIDKEYELSFGVVDEKQFGNNERFFYGDVVDALKNKMHDVEVVIGYTDDEGLMVVVSPENSVEKLLANANKYLDTFVPKPISIRCSLKDQFEVARKLKKFYVKNPIVTEEDRDAMFKCMGFDMFLQGIVLQAKICAKNKKKTYLYKFTCKTERNFLAHMLGLGKVVGDKPVTCHADDLPYLFPCKAIPSKLDKDSPVHEIIKRVTTLWTNFAKYGNPTPDDCLGVKWSPYTIEKQNYLDIGNQLVEGVNPDKEDIDLWEDVFKQYLPEWTP
ncbi:hypothetical protein O3G_MSEX001527 [Manduca sexta]|uniref:Carboxylic ester hydrolase n=1 Tax=Manduca sexta TaxID=7130 RepID=A0A921YK88_MANSE|nr:hypothetical protein O3G_MSEX001527 [Manduca sexta]KAG6440814.1 hypothetical protein O3G_MSEX001527 [Manduca sexta]KAG6440815.1 hypothetical protein O3G_MSEX001527 [Manduca sexta]KAG6440816.1 hypothetical protein O3G_MSEX001527 [Manduca sexta]